MRRRLGHRARPRYRHSVSKTRVRARAQPPSAARIAARRAGSTRHHIHRPRFSPTISRASANNLVWCESVGSWLVGLRGRTSRPRLGWRRAREAAASQGQRAQRELEPVRRPLAGLVVPRRPIHNTARTRFVPWGGCPRHSGLHILTIIDEYHLINRQTLI